MERELLAAVPDGRRRAVSVLLVHGICLGAWVWEDNFLPYFAGRGFASYALSLRGHGGSGGAARIAEWRLRDFSDDIDWAVRRIGGPVVLLGHSMGGGVAQYYLRHGHSAVGLALLASVPPHGLMRASLSMFNRNPGLWDELFKARGGELHRLDLGILERGLFSGPGDGESRRALLERMTRPAVQASIELMGWRPIAPLPWLAPPTLIVGGERDDLVPVTDVFLTGAYYGQPPEIVPQSGHAIMLEAGWQGAADRICAWLIRHFERDRRA
jgi:pimeloyl-ACP methyl ester carboxylesterase